MTTVLDIASPAFKQNPFSAFRRLRDEDPVAEVRAGQRRIWLVTRYEDAVALLKDTRFVKDQSKVTGRVPWVPKFARPLSRNMLDVDEPDHRRLRTLVTQAFSPRVVQAMRSRTEALVDELLTAMSRKNEADIVADFAVPIPTTIIAEILGVPSQDRMRFHKWTNAVVAADASSVAMLRALPAVWSAVRYLRALVQNKRANPGDDLISGMIAARDGTDRLNEDELLAMIFLLLVAGHETTANLISNAVFHLAQNTEQRERLLGDPILVSSAVEEFLRFDGPLLTATERYAADGISLNGASIPRGAVVYAAIGSANRDERVFVKPNEIDISRSPNRHLSFGDGPHFCAGAALARMEAQTAIPEIFRRMPRLSLRTSWKPRWKGGIVLHGLRGLPVITHG